jgi:hypothetical protein
MGNADSTYYSTIVDAWKHPDLVPKVTDKPKFDPNYGFAEERTPRGFNAADRFLLFGFIFGNQIN